MHPRVPVVVALFSLLTSVIQPPSEAAAASCQFVLGFKALHDMIPATVGDCVADEHHNPANGDGLQETTGASGKGGLLVWRKADNWTAFTDGHRTWIAGPSGLQQRLNTERFSWEADFRSAAQAAPPEASSDAMPGVRLQLTKVTRAPRHPAGCSSSTFDCDVAHSGFSVLAAEFSYSGAEQLRGAFDRLLAETYVVAADGTRTKVYRVGTTVGGSSQTLTFRFTPPDSARGFRLFIPGRPPIDLRE